MVGQLHSNLLVSSEKTLAEWLIFNRDRLLFFFRLAFQLRFLSCAITVDQVPTNASDLILLNTEPPSDAHKVFSEKLNLHSIHSGVDNTLTCT